MKRIIILIMLLLLIIPAGCGKVKNPHPDLDFIKSYKDIPGITQEEISAIEALKNERTGFTYGHLIITEAFRLPDGTYAGFTVKVCELLSSLFDMEFIPVNYGEWDDLKKDIDNLAVDFSGEFTQTTERMKTYHMTAPIAGRSLSVYTLAGSEEILKESDINGMKVGFLTGTVAEEMITDRYPELSFETVEVPSFPAAAGMLKSGGIDAFVTDGVTATIFEEYDFIQGKKLFQLIYSPVSITTANPDLQPVISVINKYLSAGGIDKMFELYKEGDFEYAKHKLHQSFTDEEITYLENLKAKNAKVDIGLQHDVYPVSFYNKMDKRFEGIALDILAEISKLTDIEFEPITTSTDMPLSVILAKLKNGEISMMTQLLYLESRKNDYIWSSVPYHTTNYALLSKSDYPNLEPFQVYYASVGTINKSAHEEMFTAWFPGHGNRIPYPSGDFAFDALEKGEVDLVMMAENMLLSQTNYREKPGFKINISFNKSLDSLFGYNKDEKELCSIVDKALAYIDTDAISNDWMSKNYDYTSKISKMQSTYLAFFLSGALIVLAAILFLFFKNKRLSKSLLEHTTTLSTIYISIPDIVFSMDTNLVYTSCNPGFEKFAGMSETKIIGKTDPEVFGADKSMVDYFIETNTKVLKTRETMTVQEWVTYPNGSKRYLETIKTPLYQNDKLTGLMGIARDITNLNNAVEKAREASKVKSLFLANMSHEIRTPMNAIIGMSELLMNEPLSSVQQSYVKDINISSHSLLSIINDILDFSKIEAGKLELSPIDYDFQMFIDNLRSLFKFVVQKKGLEFKFESNGDMPKCLYGDDIRLKQVLTNICGNAVKFTNKGFVMLRVTSSDNTLVFDIQDTGIGIRKEDLPKLFSAFTQADTQKNRNITGTGLGLAISKSFVHMMGGNITVDSVYGEGTVFTVTIPKIEGNENAISREGKDSEEKSFLAPSAKILVVDDNELNLKVVSGLLNLYKINAVKALSGKESIDLIQESDFDIVFMDHMMPEMDGIQTVNKIRKLGGKYEQLTIIALTANAVRGAKEMFLSNGFNGFISKPIETDELAVILKTHLPPEKIEKKQAASTENEGEIGGALSDFLISVGKISDINTEIGMSRVSGLEDMYRETLELFYNKLLAECEKLEGFLNNKDLHNFAISVHGIKSSLSTIGAMELSETAFGLETASKDGNLNYCEERFPEFAQKLRALYGNLSEIFPQAKAGAPRPEGDVEFLRENIQKALAAADDFDIDLCTEAVNKLLEYDFGEQTNTLLEAAGYALKDFDFDAAADSFNKITGA